MKHTDDLLINELGICPEVLKLVLWLIEEEAKINYGLD